MSAKTLSWELRPHAILFSSKNTILGPKMTVLEVEQGSDIHYPCNPKGNILRQNSVSGYFAAYTNFRRSDLRRWSRKVNELSYILRIRVPQRFPFSIKFASWHVCDVTNRVIFIDWSRGFYSTGGGEDGEICLFPHIWGIDRCRYRMTSHDHQSKSLSNYLTYHVTYHVAPLWWQLLAGCSVADPGFGEGLLALKGHWWGGSVYRTRYSTSQTQPCSTCNANLCTSAVWQDSTVRPDSSDSSVTPHQQ